MSLAPSPNVGVPCSVGLNLSDPIAQKLALKEMCYLFKRVLTLQRNSPYPLSPSFRELLA